MTLPSWMQNAAESCNRDGAVRARLQSNSRIEHSWRRKGAGGDCGIGAYRARRRAEPLLEPQGRPQVPTRPQPPPVRPRKICSERLLWTTLGSSEGELDGPKAFPHSQDPERSSATNFCCAAQIRPHVVA